MSVSSDLPRGLKAINVEFSFFVDCNKPSSGYLVEREYSDWTAAILNIFDALISELGDISEKPICLTLPS